MTNSNTDFKVFIKNAIKYLSFGFKMYENGVCDQPIKGDFKLVDSREMYGYTKKEASDLLGDLMAEMSDSILEVAREF